MSGVTSRWRVILTLRCRGRGGHDVRGCGRGSSSAGRSRLGPLPASDLGRRAAGRERPRRRRRRLAVVQEHRVVAAVLRAGHQVLLCHRSPGREWYPGVWDFPGGHVESEEQPEQALRRELLEEVGVDIGIVRQEPVLHLIDRDTGFDLTVWLVRNWAGTVENRQSDEHDLIGWFEVKDLPALEFADNSYLPLLQRLLLSA